MEMLGDPNPRCGSVLLMGLTGQHRGLDARGNWYGVDPRVLRRELHSKLGGSLLNLIENGPLVDRAPVGLPKDIFPYLERLASQPMLL